MHSSFKKIALPVLLVAALGTPLVAEAVQLLPPCAVSAGRCNLNDIVQTFVNFAKILLGFVGSAVLVFFIYGGFVWLTSGGSSEKVQKGKGIVVNSVIGLIIVFGAAMIVQYLSSALGARQEARVGQLCADKPGIYIQNPRSGAVECADSCDRLASFVPGYICMNPNDGVDCVTGICTGGADNVCCRPRGPTP